VEESVGTLITRLVILHSDWSSGSRDSIIASHWSFLHSFSRRVTDLCWPFTSAFRAGSPVTCQSLRSRFFRLSSPKCHPTSEAVRRHVATHWTRYRQSLQIGTGEVLNGRVDCRPGVQFRIEWNLIFQLSLEVGPVSGLKSGRSGGYLKDERHAV
jgi:hypothetical protein